MRPCPQGDWLLPTSASDRAPAGCRVTGVLPLALSDTVAEVDELFFLSVCMWPVLLRSAFYRGGEQGVHSHVREGGRGGKRAKNASSSKKRSHH